MSTPRLSPLAVSLAAILAFAAAPASAAPVPCASGTIDFTAASDTPVTLPTFNVGQKVVLTAVPVGITPSTYSWTIAGPHIKDYEERVGTTITGAISWSTTALGAADLAASPVSFYWKPAANQVHPLNAGPSSRNVSLTVTVGATSCTVSQTFSVERNSTSTSKQAVDFFTSNHRAPTETNPEKGRVIDYHMEWHQVASTRLLPFLPWHREFIGRYNAWLAEFGYPPVVPWYPGTPIPTGTDINHTPRLGSYNPDTNRVPTWYTMAGGTGDDPGASGTQKRLFDYSSLTQMSNALEFSWHGTVHCNVGPGGFGGMCDYSSPKDPLFFRWHRFVDLVYESFCHEKGLTCAPGPEPDSDGWMGDNAADIANNGTPPSTGTLYLSPDIWNRTAPATCTPANPGPGVVRNCGGPANHQDPVTGVTNYFYARVRNDRPSPVTISYLEVAVYAANASTGLAWPADFGGPPVGVPLPESRQFITVNLEPGQVTDIGPLPWIPPSPVPSDHWCVYVRMLSPQAPLGIVEGPTVWINVRDSNNIVWRNLRVVQPSGPDSPIDDAVDFIVRNTFDAEVAVDLDWIVPDHLLADGMVIELDLGDELGNRLRADAVEGAEKVGPTTYRIITPRARIAGIPMKGREAVGVTARFTGAAPRKPEVVLIEQGAGGEFVGGIGFRLQDWRPESEDTTPDEPAPPDGR